MENLMKQHFFSDLLDRYIKEHVANVKDKTKRTNQLNFWKTKVGNKFVEEVDKNYIETILMEYAAKVNRFGRFPTRATLRNYLAALSHFFTFCCRKWHYLDNNPCLLINISDNAKGGRMSVSTRMHYPKEQEKPVWLSTKEHKPGKEDYDMVHLVCTEEGDLMLGCYSPLNGEGYGKKYKWEKFGNGAMIVPIPVYYMKIPEVPEDVFAYRCQPDTIKNKN